VGVGSIQGPDPIGRPPSARFFRAINSAVRFVIPPLGKPMPGISAA
jgi:hypothetical protein